MAIVVTSGQGDGLFADLAQLVDDAVVLAGLDGDDFGVAQGGEGGVVGVDRRGRGEARSVEVFCRVAADVVLRSPVFVVQGGVIAQYVGEPDDGTDFAAGGGAAPDGQFIVLLVEEVVAVRYVEAPSAGDGVRVVRVLAVVPQLHGRAGGAHRDGAAVDGQGLAGAGGAVVEGVGAVAGGGYAPEGLVGVGGAEAGVLEVDLMVRAVIDPIRAAREEGEPIFAARPLAAADGARLERELPVPIVGVRDGFRRARAIDGRAVGRAVGEVGYLRCVGHGVGLAHGYAYGFRRGNRVAFGVDVVERNGAFVGQIDAFKAYEAPDCRVFCAVVGNEFYAEVAAGVGGGGRR